MIYFIVNKSSQSGKSKEKVNEVLRFFKKNGADYKAFITKHEGHACELAAKIIRKEYRSNSDSKSSEDSKTYIIVLGGDGTINEVVNGIMLAKQESPEMCSFTDEYVSLSVYPTGSGNDFIRGLNIKRSKHELYAVVTKGSLEYRPVDVGKVTFSDGTHKYFAISTGMGMDALVCRKAEKSSLKKVLNKFGFGKLTYIILTIQTIFSMDYVPCKIEYETVDSNGNVENESTELDKMIYIAALNLFAEGGGVPMAPNADSADGMLNVCAAYGMSRPRGFYNLIFLAQGLHEGRKGFFTKKVKSLTIKTDKAMTVHTDGEDALDRDYMKVECVKGGVNVL